MAKVVMDLGWKKVVVDAKLAIAMSELLSTSEIYETKNVKGEDGVYVTTYHIFEQEETRWLMEILPDSFYRMAKLAGKPEKE